MPRDKKSARPIVAADDVAVVFSDGNVTELAKKAKLPLSTNLTVLAEGVREAASIFARDARVPNGNELRNEIADLYHAADRDRYDEVVALLEKLSAQAYDMLEDRGAPDPSMKLPLPDALRDPIRRKGACETIARLCQNGGGYVDGRRRASGKHSRPTWRPLLHAPAPRTNFAKREAERDFVTWLSLAWLEATGSPPSRTARHRDEGRDVGPFARFARECLRQVGAPDADVVELMNELHKRRREMERHTDEG